MPIDFSDLLLATLLHAAALVASAIIFSYLAIILPVTFAAWFVNALDTKKILLF